MTLQKKQRGGDWSSYRPHCGARGYKVKLNGVLIVHHILKNNADFIATFNLKVAMVLPGELEAKDKRIAELTDALTQIKSPLVLIMNALLNVVLTAIRQKR